MLSKILVPLQHFTCSREPRMAAKLCQPRCQEVVVAHIQSVPRLCGLRQPRPVALHQHKRAMLTLDLNLSTACSS